MNVFDFVNSITHKKNDMFEDAYDANLLEKEYSAFIVNRALSYHNDTVLYANEMNKPDIPSRLQYEYLINIIRKRKRFSKWSKKNENEYIKLIMQYFNYNEQKAKDALNILTDDDLERIKSSYDRGE